ncbi:unnamed protein product [Prorocentrum cordatum]|uniref:Uncharacterized protein n=1 Tax=Prorocentrum cordatum TaxID=2364126 RepID=A0ABN9Q3Z4_9DINO|nr:unnamed protein product [Polarella glacialis]
MDPKVEMDWPQPVLVEVATAKIVASSGREFWKNVMVSELRGAKFEEPEQRQASFVSDKIMVLTQGSTQEEVSSAVAKLHSAMETIMPSDDLHLAVTKQMCEVNAIMRPETADIELLTEALQSSQQSAAVIVCALQAFPKGRCALSAAQKVLCQREQLLKDVERIESIAKQVCAAVSKPPSAMGSLVFAEDAVITNASKQMTAIHKLLSGSNKDMVAPLLSSSLKDAVEALRVSSTYAVRHIEKAYIKLAKDATSKDAVLAAVVPKWCPDSFLNTLIKRDSVHTDSFISEHLPRMKRLVSMRSCVKDAVAVAHLMKETGKFDMKEMASVRATLVSLSGSEAVGLFADQASDQNVKAFLAGLLDTIGMKEMLVDMASNALTPMAQRLADKCKVIFPGAEITDIPLENAAVVDKIVDAEGVFGGKGELDALIAKAREFLDQRLADQVGYLALVAEVIRPLCRLDRLVVKATDRGASRISDELSWDASDLRVSKQLLQGFQARVDMAELFASGTSGTGRFHVDVLDGAVPMDAQKFVCQADRVLAAVADRWASDLKELADVVTAWIPSELTLHAKSENFLDVDGVLLSAVCNKDYKHVLKDNMGPFLDAQIIKGVLDVEKHAAETVALTYVVLMATAKIPAMQAPAARKKEAGKLRDELGTRFQRMPTTLQDRIKALEKGEQTPVKDYDEIKKNLEKEAAEAASGAGGGPA